MFRRQKHIYIEGADDKEALQKIESLAPNTKHLYLQSFLPFLTDITLDANRLPKLKSLYLLNIDFAQFPEWIFNFRQLRKLMVRGCSITYVPERIVELDKLESLRIENCDIDSLPKSLSEMKQLKKLSVICDFKLKNIPTDCIPRNLKAINCTPSGLPQHEKDRLLLSRPGLKFKSFV